MRNIPDTAEAKHIRYQKPISFFIHPTTLFWFEEDSFIFAFLLTLFVKMILFGFFFFIYFSSFSLWRTHDWSHGLPIVRQAFVVFRPGYAIHSIFFPASSVRCIAFRPCLTQTLCQHPCADSPTAVQALKVDSHHGSHASPRYRCFVIWLFPSPECLSICDRFYPLLG